MAITQRQLIMLETNALRDKAEALLKGLMDAKTVTERELARLNRPDVMRMITGRSSIEDGIASTRRMIETLNKSLAQAKRDLDDEDIALLDELLDEEPAAPQSRGHVAAGPRF